MKPGLLLMLLCLSTAALAEDLPTDASPIAASMTPLLPLP
ncbi:Uncharacterised protein [Pantoea agglomerans]|uniref:Uncharacterized protein n=1 Tax=Enterobacter agglomerans TaxID=549 RepID=A0A379AAE5_ENTAG|nr:Uncharacterised protein [Pantoea agglomerans]